MEKYGKKPQKEAEKSVRKDQKIENKKQAATSTGFSKQAKREEPKAPKKNN